MLFLTAFLVIAIASARITDFVLVNTKTGRDVMLLIPETVIDIAEHGDQLSVRVEASSEEDTIKLDLDHGYTIRMEARSPVYLAGTDYNRPEVVFPSNTLARVGSHSLTACTASTKATTRRLEHDTRTENDNACVTINFETVNGRNRHTPSQPTVSKTDVEPIPASAFGSLSGDLRQWHKVTIGFRGPPASETGMTVPGVHRAPTPFADYRLDVTFEHKQTGKVFVVPGYYAADGNAANTHSVSGSVWAVHFSPPLVGRYSWRAEFTQGTDVAVNRGGNPGHFFNDASGWFDVNPSDKDDERDFRSSKGRLVANGGRYFNFSNGKQFLKAGPDSPTNILAFDDFDGTTDDSSIPKSFAAHRADYSAGEGRTFADGKGTALLGAINYLSNKGVNTLTVTTLHGKEVFPFKWTSNLLQYDVSKLAQWGTIFDYANERGLTLRIRLQSDDALFDDDGRLRDERKLYYREMVARFSHNIALVWDLGSDLAPWQVSERSRWLRRLDPYGDTPITVRLDGEANSAVFEWTNVDGVSLYSSDASVYLQTSAWLSSSGLAVSNDRQGLGVLPEDEIEGEDRHDTLWANLMAQGAGAQYFFSSSHPESDLSLQDFRSRDDLWEVSSYALRFFEQFDMATFSVCGAGCLEDGRTMIQYPATNPDVGVVLYWFNPRTGKKSLTRDDSGAWAVVLRT